MMKSWKQIAGRTARIIRPESSSDEPHDGRRVTCPIPPETWDTYTPKRAPVSRLFLIANDNHRPAGLPVGMPNDGPPSGHMAAVAAAGYAVDYGQLGTRIMRALKSHEPVAYRRLLEIAELVRPAELRAANDNTLIDDDVSEPDTRDWGLETVQNQGSIKPSPGELLRAFADGLRPRVVTAKQRDGGAGRVRNIAMRFAGGVQCTTSRLGDSFVEIGGHAARRFYGVQFYNGALLAYSDKKGRRKLPIYDATEPTVEKPDPDSATARHLEDWPNIKFRHIARIGANDWATSPQNAPTAPIGFPWLWTSMPPRKAEMRRKLAIAMHGHPVTYLPVGFAQDCEFDNSVSKPRPTAGKGAPIAIAELARDIPDIPKDKLRIIEAVFANDNYRQIGLAHGAAASSAHKIGKRLVLDALAPSNDNIPAQAA